MRTKGHILFAVPPHFAGRCHIGALTTPTVLLRASAGADLSASLRCLSRSRYNGLTHADLFSAQTDFFSNQSRRRSTLVYRGGFQPAATPSLSVYQSFTLPRGFVSICLSILYRVRKAVS